MVRAAAKAFDADPTDECLLRYGSMLVIGIFLLHMRNFDWYHQPVTIEKRPSLYVM